MLGSDPAGDVSWATRSVLETNAHTARALSTELLMLVLLVVVVLLLLLLLLLVLLLLLLVLLTWR